MSSDPACDRTYPMPQVFLVDGGGGGSLQHGAFPNLVPCWSFPPAQDRARGPEKSRSCTGVRMIVLLLLFALLFAGLGIETVWTINLQKELKEMKRMVTAEEVKMGTGIAPQKQTGLYEPRLKEADKKARPAAHVIARTEKEKGHKTLRWEPGVGRAFTAGGVTYKVEDGALQVNETGLYHIYTRVELLFRDCSPTSSFRHSVFVKSALSSPLTLMEAHKHGFCSKTEGRAVTQDSYLSSIRRLKKDDEVLVNVSDPDLLNHEHYANFFGLYKI